LEVAVVKDVIPQHLTALKSSKRKTRRENEGLGGRDMKRKFRGHAGNRWSSAMCTGPIAPKRDPKLAMAG